MKIKKLKIFLSELKYHEPFRIALGTSTLKKAVIIELHTDNGIIGYGEAAPSSKMTGETIQGVVEVLKNYLFPTLIGMDSLAIEEIHHKMDQVILGNASAKAAIDIALYDLNAKTFGIPLVKFLGGEKFKIQTDITIGIKSPTEMAESAKKFVKDGFKILKIKVGREAQDDLTCVKAVRKAVGDEIKLRVDANQGWDNSKTAINLIKKMEEFKIELIEQPLKYWDLKGLAEIRKKVNIPIAADESVHSPRDAQNLAQIQAVDIFNIKLMKCGGIYQAKKINHIAESAGIACMIGGMIESKIAVGAAASLASSCKNIHYADLDADLLLNDDLVKDGGLGLKDGFRIIPDKPGLGIEKLNLKYLKEI